MMKVGAAVIGAGFMGGVHTEALRRAGCEVVGVLGVSPEESRSFADKVGAPKAFQSLDELLGDPSVESIHIGTPNKLHFAMAKAGLEAGKHVLCEKPLAMSSKETSELVALAKKHRHLAAGVNYNIRFYPLAIEARERVRSGSLGRIHHVAGSYVQDWLLLDTDYNWRVLAEEGGELPSPGSKWRHCALISPLSTPCDAARKGRWRRSRASWHRKLRPSP
jgi:predicted dehydrogenase